MLDEEGAGRGEKGETLFQHGNVMRVLKMRQRFYQATSKKGFYKGKVYV